MSLPPTQPEPQETEQVPAGPSPLMRRLAVAMFVIPAAGLLFHGLLYCLWPERHPRAFSERSASCATGGRAEAGGAG